MWNQVYDPFGSAVLSTLAAALPVVTLLVLIATGKVKAHLAAVVALIVAILVAILLFTMPAGLAPRAAGLGRGYRVFPDRLDRAQCHLSLPADGGDRRIRNAVAGHRRGYPRPAVAATAH